MITVWGRNNSINVQKALWALAETGTQFERRDAGGRFGGLDTPEYRALNPNGRIPTLVDGEAVIWESNAVVRYVAAKYGEGDLWPADPAVRAAGDMWMDWTQTTVLPDMFPVFWGLIRTPEDERDMDVVNAHAAKLGESYAILDRALAGRPYIAGDAMTMGDIPLGAYVWRYTELPIEHPALPNVEAYHARLQERAAFREHVMLPLT